MRSSRLRSRLVLVGGARSEDVINSVIGTANGHDVDLLVVGSRGRGALARAVLGSVSEGLIHETSIPTVIVHPDDHEDD